MKAPKIFVTTCQSIFYNLSFEEILMREVTSPMLFIYRNNKNVVIGRHQNPWREIHMDRLREDNIELCRRKSGGGAVYQDLGNTSFSFITPGPPEFSYKAKNNSIILRALNALGIEAEVSGRNDILVESKKVSGSAYKIIPQNGHNVYLHHGTMLLNIDKEGLFRYLNPHRAKLQSKGITSVKSRVLNLTEVKPDLTHEMFVETLIKSYRKDYTDAVEQILVDYPPGVEEMAQEMLKWEWRYGETPQFTYELENRFEWGIIDMHLQVDKGIITQVKVFSDCLDPEFVTYLERVLLNQPYGHEATEAIPQRIEDPNWKEMAEELSEWLKGQI